MERSGSVVLVHMGSRGRGALRAKWLRSGVEWVRGAQWVTEAQWFCRVGQRGFMGHSGSVGHSAPIRYRCLTGHKGSVRPSGPWVAVSVWATLNPKDPVAPWAHWLHRIQGLHGLESWGQVVPWIPVAPYSQDDLLEPFLNTACKPTHQNSIQQFSPLFSTVRPDSPYSLSPCMLSIV